MKKLSYDDYPHNHNGSVSVRLSANELSEKFRRIDDVTKKTSIRGGVRNGKEI